MREQYLVPILAVLSILFFIAIIMTLGVRASSFYKSNKLLFTVTNQIIKVDQSFRRASFHIERSIRSLLISMIFDLYTVPTTPPATLFQFKYLSQLGYTSSSSPLGPDYNLFQYSNIMLDDISHQLAKNLFEFNSNSELNLLDDSILQTIFKSRMAYNQFGNLSSSGVSFETSQVSVNTYLKAIVQTTMLDAQFF